MSIALGSWRDMAINKHNGGDGGYTTTGRRRNQEEAENPNVDCPAKSLSLMSKGGEEWGAGNRQGLFSF